MRCRFVFFLCGILLVSFFPFEGYAVGSDKPNIILITIDDLNDWVGCLKGHPQARTPNLDRLAKRGILFTNAHCNAPICNPSRSSLMSGRRPSTTGCYDNSNWLHNSPVVEDKDLLPRHFEAQGYETVGCGKLFHGSKGKEFFQRYGPALGQGPLPEKRFHVTEEASKTKLWDWGEYPPTNEEAHDFITAEFAEKELQARHDKPLFLGIGFYRPHVPCYAPPEWFRNFPITEVQLPPFLENDLDDISPSVVKLIRNGSVAPPHTWFVENNKWKSAVQAYLASVEFMDYCLGKVIRALDAGPNAHNTWIFLTGDHGWHLGEKETWAKRTLWERSTRVPMLIVPPKNNGKDGDKQYAIGKECALPVEMLSFYPTMVEVAGIPSNQKTEGVSLLPLLLDPDSADWNFPAITTHLKDNHSIRDRNWRYTRYADGAEELYDHRKDPNEWKNIVAEPGSEEVIDKLKKWLPTMNANPAGGKNPYARKKRGK